MTNPLIVYSLPVSGGSFPAQLALLSEFYEANKILKYYPDIILASSGGNLASYIAYAGDWSPEGILRVCKNITSDAFIQSWFSPQLDFLPSFLIGMFKGSFYKSGYGANYFIKRYFTPETIQNVEIWSGTYNKNKNSAEFFCNRFSERALIQERYFEGDSYIYSVTSLNYLKKDEDILNKIGKIIIASASIPYTVEPQHIDEYDYQDGGTMYASPTSILCNEIYRIFKGETFDKVFTLNSKSEISVEKEVIKPKRLRHFYFSPYDINSSEVIQSWKTLNMAVTQILYANLLSDRASAILNLQHIYEISYTQLIHQHYSNITTTQFAQILKNIDIYEHYVCDIYPIGIPGINIENINYDEILKIIKQVRNNYGVQIWYYDKI